MENKAQSVAELKKANKFARECSHEMVIEIVDKIIGTMVNGDYNEIITKWQDKYKEKCGTCEDEIEGVTDDIVGLLDFSNKNIQLFAEVIEDSLDSYVIEEYR
jgi:hypothetical protein